MTLTEQDINWTGEEIVKYGKHADGVTKWKDLHRNTVDWYMNNLQSGPLKSCAEAEMARRNEEDEY